MNLDPVPAPRRHARPGSLHFAFLAGSTLVLTLAVAAFAAVLYATQRSVLLGGVDSSLAHHGAAIAAASEIEFDGKLEIDLDDEYLAQFDGRVGAPAFAIWDDSGERRFATPAVSAVPRPTEEGARVDGSVRRWTARSPKGLWVSVAEDAAGEQRALLRFLAMLIGTGMCIVAVGAALGWVVARRVLAPIERISKTAAAISSANLSERIDVDSTESELGRLAITLNSAFDRLQEAVQRQSRFTADASHELRTPVSILLTTAEQVLTRPRSELEYREAFQVVERTTRRMRSLVEGLLILARRDAGEKPVFSAVALAPIVEETVDHLRHLARTNRVQLSIAGEDASVFGDAALLRLLVTNLISNALRYNRPDGTVEVAAASCDREVELRVTDSGRGIAADHLPHIFERFYRADSSRNSNHGGAGLGLALCAQIVEVHGGSIRAESTVDLGTTIRVRLPAADVHPSSSNGRASPETSLRS